MTATHEKPEMVKEHFESISRELAKVIVGQKTLIKDLFICLLCGGHALIEGVPGLGKTLTVKTLSRILDLKYSRIQFTPDLMPADILGTNIVNQDDKGNRYFEFYRGPIFGQVILADEINRASPKTQSAMLEAMQEERVTVFGAEYLLEPPFIVLATQNPLEMEGTYPLPEAQIDRFFFKLKVEYPTPQELGEILEKTTEHYQPELQTVLHAEQILEMKKMVKQVPIASHVKEYAIRIILATHPANEWAADKTKQFVRYGASPRAVQALVMAGKVLALLKGRYNVAFEDIREAAKPTLRHRIIMNLKGEAEGIDVDDIVEEILVKVTGELGK
ncbi:MAG: MoxR family ATPase [Desulfobacteraceae bacterium]|nr:MAG: MoxR family ATPase [Desulfobacteraceae bacterium]